MTIAIVISGCRPEQKSKTTVGSDSVDDGQPIYSDPNEPFLFSDDDFAKNQADSRKSYCATVAFRTYQGKGPSSPKLVKALRQDDHWTARQELAADVATPTGLSAPQRRWIDLTRKSLELTAASARGDVDAVKKLLAEGADPNFAVEDRKTMGPMAWAALCDRADVVKALVAAGGQVDQVFSWEVSREQLFFTPLGLAADQSAAASVVALLKAGADPNAFYSTPEARRGWGGSGLPPLVGTSTHKVVEALLDGGANPDVANAGGWTPLMNAAEWNDPGKITLLLQYGANPKLRNDNGDTALDMARRNPSNESVLALTGTAPKRRYPRGRAQTVH
jgi:hypothetical protein